ncbi:MAG: hypothetical protein RI560_13860, partial [Natronomonas sp.]|nr:hypothetical protein [Natronomonas sp.]
YTVTGISEGSDVTVGIATGDTTSNTAADIFRNVGDVSDVELIQADGSEDGNAPDTDGTVIAVLEVDGGSAVGSIDTTTIDTGDIDVDVYDTTFISEDSTAESEETETLTVNEGEITLDSPTGTYTIGSKVTVSGTASEGIDRVAIYARSGGDWEWVDLSQNPDGIEVDPDGTFEHEDV